MGEHSAYLIIDVVIILLLIAGIGLFRTPPNAWRGTLLATLAMVAAVAAVLVRIDINRPELIIVALLVGALVGLFVAFRVNMIQIPAMIAFQHGAGGMAAFLVCSVELWRGAAAGMETLQVVAGLAGLLVGAGTFSASLIAGGKLANLMPTRPLTLRGHNPILLVLAVIALGLAIAAGFAAGGVLVALLVAVVVVLIALGVLVAVRVGGADMPVLISTLNATAGFAAAFSGIILESYLLVAAGATVAASGSVLTHVMCKAMNRRLLQVFTGIRRTQRPAAAPVPRPAPTSYAASASAPAPAAAAAGAGAGFSLPISPMEGGAGAALAAVPPDGERAPAAPAGAAAPDPFQVAAAVLKDVRRAIVVPGYGMAVAQAQSELVSLARKLEQNGAEVSYAIHPVAGRMPGHMNVLLAEADVPYDRLVEMDDINPRFKDADVALVVGACDVVNPAAIAQEGTPISGMPILRALDARSVVVCNFDEKPGYSGVDNPLYQEPGSILLWGDAKQTLRALNDLIPD